MAAADTRRERSSGALCGDSDRGGDTDLRTDGSPGIALDIKSLDGHNQGIAHSVVVRLGHSARQQIRKLAEDLSKPQAHVVGELIKMGLISEEDIVESVSLQLASRRLVREQEARR